MTNQPDDSDARPNLDEWVSEPVQRDLSDEFASDPLGIPSLDDVFPGFADGASPILWSATMRLARPGPSEEVRLEGPDWRLQVIVDEPFEIPGFSDDGQRDDQSIDPPVALLSVSTGATRVTAARDAGRPLIRALIGYFRLRSPILVGAELLWEGPIVLNERGIPVVGAGNFQAFVRPSPRGIEETRLALLGRSAASFVSRHRLALEWMTEAWQAHSVPVRFVNLWTALVTAVDASYSARERRGLEQMERIERYLPRLPISTARRREMLETFEVGYSLRNRIVHQGDREAVDAEAIASLREAVSDFLLADIGRTAADG